MPAEQMELYPKRQAIEEHPYGVIKRQWGFYYITLKHPGNDCYNQQHFD
tara:strand:+ start:201 stop:347 length:147 start_codon:yes stop_codon:yes gene_type:complete